MVGKTIPPTAEEKMRMQLISDQAFGCIPCMLEGVPPRMATVQHVVEGRKRLGHAVTYGACTWHHFGHPLDGLSQDQTEQKLGPSLALRKRAYNDRYGGEAVLVEIQDWLIGQWVGFQWFAFEIPPEVVQHATEYWVKLRNSIN